MRSVRFTNVTATVPTLERWQISYVCCFVYNCFVFRFVLSLIEARDRYVTNLWLISSMFLMILSRFQEFLSVPLWPSPNPPRRLQHFRISVCDCRDTCKYFPSDSSGRLLFESAIEHNLCLLCNANCHGCFLSTACRTRVRLWLVVTFIYYLKILFDFKNDKIVTSTFNTY